MINELANLYPSKREKWIIENNNIYVSWKFKDPSLDFIIKDFSDIRRIKRCVKIKYILDEIEKEKK